MTVTLRLSLMMATLIQKKIRKEVLHVEEASIFVSPLQSQFSVKGVEF